MFVTNRDSRSTPSRRDVLRVLVGGSASVGLSALTGLSLAGCTGFATTGGGGLIFLSTQFRPVAEAERFRALLAGHVNPAIGDEISYVTVEEGPFASQVRSQVGSGATQMGLLGGLHGDLAPLAGEYLEDLTDFVRGLGERDWPRKLRELAMVGTDRTWYVPWAQATYVLAAHADALEHLPPGADVQNLTYDQFLDWAIAARRANGNKPMLGMPAGPEGLLHRFLQGYLLPSFTGGQITTFRSPEALAAWEYLHELWANTSAASTTYDFMQDPLESGAVRFGWDHVVRLVSAPERDPDNWRMAPAPRGPHGLGYMAVVLGLSLPENGTDPELAKRAIDQLCTEEVQVELLRSNGFFPALDVSIPDDLPPAIRLEAGAVARQQDAEDAVLSLPPVGLGTREGEVTKVFKDCFRSIILENADIRTTVDRQARILQGILDELAVPCWPPDPHAARCEVG